MVQPFGHIPADMFIRLQFHIRVPTTKINLFQKPNALNIPRRNKETNNNTKTNTKQNYYEFM
jgi:hypothetical protein